MEDLQPGQASAHVGLLPGLRTRHMAEPYDEVNAPPDTTENSNIFALSLPYRPLLNMKGIRERAAGQARQSVRLQCRAEGRAAQSAGSDVQRRRASAQEGRPGRDAAGRGRAANLSRARRRGASHCAGPVIRHPVPRAICEHGLHPGCIRQDGPGAGKEALGNRSVTIARHSLGEVACFRFHQTNLFASF